MKHGKPAFVEGLNSPKVSPLYDGVTQFDYDAIDRPVIMDDEDAHKADLKPLLSELVTKLFDWVTRSGIQGPQKQAVAGRRFYALAWVVNPAIFGGMSAAKVAKSIGIASPCNFQKLTGEAAMEFGIVNRSQEHGWNRGNKGLSRSQDASSTVGDTKTGRKRSKPLKSNPTHPHRGVARKESFTARPKRAGSESAPQICTERQKIRVP